jgi:hypothetical protein
MGCVRPEECKIRRQTEKQFSSCNVYLLTQHPSLPQHCLFLADDYFRTLRRKNKTQWLTSPFRSITKACVLFSFSHCACCRICVLTPFDFSHYMNCFMAKLIVIQISFATNTNSELSFQYLVLRETLQTGSYVQYLVLRETLQTGCYVQFTNMCTVQLPHCRTKVSSVLHYLLSKIRSYPTGSWKQHTATVFVDSPTSQLTICSQL